MQVNFEMRKANKEYVCCKCKKQIKSGACYMHKCLHDENTSKYINSELCKDCTSAILKAVYLKQWEKKFAKVYAVVTISYKYKYLYIFR